MALYSAPGVWDGPRVGLGWLGLVVIDVDHDLRHARGRALDKRHTQNQKKIQLPDIKTVSFARAEVKTAMAARLGRGHETHHRLQWQSALFFFALGAERRIASRGRFLCRSAPLAAQEMNENKVVVCVCGSRQKTREVGAVQLRWASTASTPARRRK